MIELNLEEVIQNKINPITTAVKLLDWRVKYSRLNQHQKIICFYDFSSKETNIVMYFIYDENKYLQCIRYNISIYKNEELIHSKKFYVKIESLDKIINEIMGYL